MGRRVAILGGGMGALAAAFELSRHGDCEVTVHQLGWRLGGKCASGRNDDADHGHRIEEHGLHVWAGFYHRAATLLNECHAELAATAGPSLTWEDTFEPLDSFSLMERVDGAWRHWPVTMPRRPGRPGDGSLLASPIALVAALIAGMDDAATGILGILGAGEKHGTEPPLARARRLVEASRDAGAGDVTEQEWSAQQAVGDLDDFLGTLHEAPASKLHLGDGLRRARILFEIGAVLARGLLADGIALRGFDAIDDVELTAWMRSHGASREALASPIVQGGYDYVFGYAEGDTSRRSVSAGTAVKGFLRILLDYRGAFFWKLKGSMAEQVITPIYEVLRRRGVRFRFFHRVDELVPSSDGEWIDAIRVGVQAAPASGDYDPLLPGTMRWPCRPRFDALHRGAALRAGAHDLEADDCAWPDENTRVLRRGEHFDHAILAIPVGAQARICAPLVRQKPAWRRMVEGLETVGTLAVQLWLEPTCADLGWTRPGSILTGFAQPLATWADLSHLVDVEDWPAARRPGAIAYFCQAAPDAWGASPDAARAEVRRAAERWLDHHAPVLWPKARHAGGHGFDHDLLFDPSGRAGRERLAFQYFRANVNGCDRYVRNAPGAARLRMAPDGSGYRNLFLAGDWVRTDLNAGAVEAAVEAGLEAARALRRA